MKWLPVEGTRNLYQSMFVQVEMLAVMLMPRRWCSAKMKVGMATESRAEQWRTLCRNEVLEDIPISQVFKRSWMCSKLFAENQFTYKPSGKLNGNVLSSLFLPLVPPC